MEFGMSHRSAYSPAVSVIAPGCGEVDMQVDHSCVVYAAAFLDYCISTLL